MSEDRSIPFTAESEEHLIPAPGRLAKLSSRKDTAPVARTELLSDKLSKISQLIQFGYLLCESRVRAEHPEATEEEMQGLIRSAWRKDGLADNPDLIPASAKRWARVSGES